MVPCEGEEGRKRRRRANSVTRRLHSSLATALLVTLVSGCTAPRLSDSYRAGSGYVVCLRGLGDVFSLGMNEMAHRLRLDGIPAVATNGCHWRGLADQVDEIWRRGERIWPLVLIGHSYGADNAVRMARALDRDGVEVDLLVLLDATNPGAIPGNVRRCVHYYQPTVFGDLLPGVFAGQPVRAASGNTKSVVCNCKLTTAAFGNEVRGVNHFNIDTSEFVQRRVLDKIVALFHSSPDADTAPGPAGAADETPSCVISHR